ncbi:MAG TPA: hypothetical protein VMT00_13665 [Thermoanaerobaculia bacterium]|nr:hypothetical protein [Thermoanaerobaculia bacterium]
MNAILIRYGDSIRGHGLGMILFSFAFGQIWQATKHPTAAKTTAAGALALLAIHTSYYNVILVGATSVGALVVCLRNGRRRNAIALISIGTAMAMSMLIYIPASRAVSSWNASLRHGVDGSLLWGTLTDVMAHGGPHLRAIWVAFLAVAAGILISHVAGLVKLEPDRSDAVIFGGVTLLTGLVGYTFFLLMLGYYTHPWYFVSMLLLVAICCDVILQQGTVPPHSAAYAIAAAILAVMMFAPVQLLLAVPQTNIDAVALELHDKAQQSDLILVREWELGISFQRYYHGSAEWMTLPPLEDHRWHRYDLFRAAHTDSSWWPIVNQRFRQTIESGGAIWVVAGGLLETDCARAHVGEAFDILVFPSHFLEIQTRQDRIWRPANRAAAYENVIVERRISCK